MKKRLHRIVKIAGNPVLLVILCGISGMLSGVEWGVYAAVPWIMVIIQVGVIERHLVSCREITVHLTDKDIKDFVEHYRRTQWTGKNSEKHEIK